VHCQSLDNGHLEKGASLWGELHSPDQARQSRLRSRTCGRPGPFQKAGGESEVGCSLRHGWFWDCVQKHGTCGDPERMMDGWGECQQQGEQEGGWMAPRAFRPGHNPTCGRELSAEKEGKRE